MSRHSATTIIVAFCLIGVASFSSSSSLSTGWAAERARESFAGERPLDCATNPRGGSKDDKLTVEEGRSPDGTIGLRLRGARVDGRGWINAVMSCLDADQAVLFPRDVDLDIKIDTLTGYGDEALRDVVVQISARAGRMRSFSLSAKLGNHGALRGEFRIDGQAPPFIQIEADDAGALLRLMNLYARMTGGVMSADIRLAWAGKQDVEGKFEIRDFSVAEPTLLRLECMRHGCSANRNLKLGRLQAEFIDEGGVLTIRDAMIRAPSLGATMNGTVEARTRVMNLYGVALWAPHFSARLVPSCLGEPAQILNYKLSGPAQAPNLRIDPLSLLSWPSVWRRFAPCLTTATDSTALTGKALAASSTPGTSSSGYGDDGRRHACGASKPIN
jgi:hypothetical protein